MTTDSIQSARDARSREVEMRVRAAIDELLAAGAPVSFYSVADRAQVARSTLYHRVALKRLVVGARDAGKPAGFGAACADLARENAELRRAVSHLEDDLARQRGLAAHRLCLDRRYTIRHAFVRLPARVL